jgi:hypothetical protein
MNPIPYLRTILTPQNKLLLSLALGLLLLFSSACASPNAGGRVRLSAVRLAPLPNMPDYVQDSPVDVQEAYQFAAANPDLVKQFPCYCGCNSLGHTSNYECYLNRQGEFDNHAAFCQVCIDITQDVMRMSSENKEIAEMRSFIVNKYSQYGPSTDTKATHDAMPAMAGSQPAGSTGSLPQDEPATQAGGSCGKAAEATSCSSTE